MLTKMPTETKSKTQPSQLDTKYFAGVVIVIAVLGMMGGYTIFPMLQSPKELILTSNLTNNNSTNSSPAVKHSAIVTDKSADTSTQNQTGTSKSKNTDKSNTSKPTSSTKDTYKTTNNEQNVNKTT